MNQIIKTFLDEGYITKEGAARLEVFEDMVKEAGPDWLTNIKNTLFAVLKDAAPAAIGVGVAGYVANKLADRAYEEKKQQQLHNIQASFATVMQSDKSFSINPDRTRARFNEIAHFSPSIASIPSVASKVLKKTLNKGLDQTDIANLVQIEVGNRQINQIVKPDTFAGSMIRSQAAGPIADMSRGMIHSYLTEEGRQEGKMNPVSSPAHLITAFEIIGKHGLLPSSLSPFANKFREPEGVEAIGAFMSNPANGAFITETITKNKLVEEYNTKTGPIKQASFAGLSLETQAQLLADIYSFEKVAFKGSWKGPALGVGAAALAGLIGGLVEEGGDYARTKKMNEAINKSWQESSSRLKKLTSEGSSLSGTIDYKDKENQRKAEEAFRVLSDISPSLAANSTIATSFVNNIVQNEGVITPDIIKMLSETQKNINTSKEYQSPFASNPMAQGFGSGFSALGGREFLRSVAQHAGEKS